MSPRGAGKRKSGELRWGLSTGTYVAALCSAAYLSYSEDWRKSEITLIFPDKKERTVPLQKVENGFAVAQKDGGDDPDVTNGAIISVKIIKDGSSSEHDYDLKIGNAQISLHGKSGIGLCTRAGLPCDKGKWAINPVPRQMIRDNLIRFGFGATEEKIRAEITVENGEAIGARTLNPRLGIIGGISILGTSGLVRPYSHKAYIDTIRIVVKGAVDEGFTEVLFSTGTRTAATAKKSYPHLSEEQVILIGDYIQEALQSAESEGISNVIVSCMPGKLSKYSAGYTNTHAHRNNQDLSHLRRLISDYFPDRENIPENCPSVREALHNFTLQEQQTLLKALKPIALNELKKHAPGIGIEILLCDFNGEVIE